MSRCAASCLILFVLGIVLSGSTVAQEKKDSPLERKAKKEFSKRVNKAVDAGVAADDRHRRDVPDAERRLA